MAIADPRLIKTPGRYFDGSGLYLDVVRRADDRLSKNWMFRYSAPTGARRDMGLGAYPAIGLAAARDLVRDARELLRKGIDPLDARRAAREDAKTAADKNMTFKAATSQFLAANEAEWVNAKHRQQWRSTLETYAYPTLGELPCGEITPAHVIEVLKPIWTAKRETAKRVRGRVERILDYAAVKGARDRNAINPALWKGNLEHAFPRRSTKAVKHHAALPFAEIPAFMADLSGREALSARCLEITILTALRTAESIGARAIEMDLVSDDAVWTVPARRMKKKREHRIPLAPAVAAKLKTLAKLRPREADFLFPGRGKSGHLSDMAMLSLLKDMDRTGFTVHGFRSSFRDWASEKTKHDANAVEMALAHVIENKTEAAYRRGDLFEKRAALMADWAGYCLSLCPAPAVEEAET